MTSSYERIMDPRRWGAMKREITCSRRMSELWVSESRYQRWELVVLRNSFELCRSAQIVVPKMVNDW